MRRQGRISRFVAVATIAAAVGVAPGAASATPSGEGTSIRTIAGNGTLGSCGDGGPARQACVANPLGVSVDGSGAMYISSDNFVRRVAPGGRITTVAGSGVNGFCGDHGPATAACLKGPEGVAVDTEGNIYIADTGNHRIRKVNSHGVITTIAGKTHPRNCQGDAPVRAVKACLYDPVAVTVDSAGVVYVADYTAGRVWAVASGMLSRFAGARADGTCGGPVADETCLYALSAVLAQPEGLYIAEITRHEVFFVDTTATLHPFAGGTYGSCGDGGPAIDACFQAPTGLGSDGHGNVYISDYGTSSVRHVDPSGTITLLAGGVNGSCKNRGVAVGSCFNFPWGIGVDPSGNVDIADYFNNRVRQVSAS